MHTWDPLVGSSKKQLVGSSKGNSRALVMKYDEAQTMLAIRIGSLGVDHLTEQHNISG